MKEDEFVNLILKSYRNIILDSETLKISPLAPEIDKDACIHYVYEVFYGRVPSTCGKAGKREGGVREEETNPLPFTGNLVV